MSQDARAFSWESIPTKSAQTADPVAPNAPATIVIPAGKKWLFLGGMCQMVAAVAAADRYMIISVNPDATNATFETMNASAQTTGQTRTYVVGDHGIPGTLIVSRFFLPMPPIELNAAATITFTPVSWNGADDCGKFTYQYKEVPA